MSSVHDTVNYRVTQGDTFPLTLTYKDPNGTAINLTGYTFRLEVRENFGGEVLSAVCTLGDGITVPDVTTGVINISISSAKTNKFNYPRSAFQLQATDQYGKKTTLLQGWFIVNAGVIN